MIFSIKCRKCGHYQVKQTSNLSEARFKCNQCEQTYKIYGAEGWNVDYKEHYNVQVAVGYCMDKNAK
jgi:Zn finger protein HypA/HybF involved in hydrogenase expression